MAKLIKTSRFSKSGRALEFKMGVKFSSDTTVHSFFFFSAFICFNHYPTYGGKRTYELERRNHMVV